MLKAANSPTIPGLLKVLHDLDTQHHANTNRRQMLSALEDAFDRRPPKTQE